LLGEYLMVPFAAVTKMGLLLPTVYFCRFKFLDGVAVRLYPLEPIWRLASRRQPPWF